MLKFAITGVAGYVAPRHLRAIKDCGGTVVAAIDPFDSVGILDSYNKDCFFTKDWKEFCSYCSFEQPDYFVICSPNVYHFEQCLTGLRLKANVICEKPVVLTLTDIKRLQDCEEETGTKVNTILQVRLKPELQALKDRVTNGHKVFLRYYTPRGKWYHITWKAQTRCSGGLATNIGVHMFDTLLWIFGENYKKVTLIEKNDERIVGSFTTDKALVEFDLSISPNHEVTRTLMVDDELVDFTTNFTNLHSESYRHIIEGNGFGLDIAKPSVGLCEKIRHLSSAT